MSVVLLTNSSNRGETLAHLIKKAGLDLRLVVVENPQLNKAQKSGVPERTKNLLRPFYRFVVDRLTLSKLERAALKYEELSILKANEMVDDYISSMGVNGRLEEVDYLETESLNEATVVTAIKNAEPDVCVVLGTSIIKERLISIPRLGMLNAHTSILPEYRGARSEFWQCYNEDYENVGITIHFIDKGVDTGRILFQKKQEVGENPDPNLLRANNTIATLSNYVNVINSVLNGNANPTEQGIGTTPTYRFRDITTEKRIKLYSRILERGGLC